MREPRLGAEPEHLETKARVCLARARLEPHRTLRNQKQVLDRRHGEAASLLVAAVVVEMCAAVFETVPALVAGHSLRGYDAVQLAAAVSAP